MAVVIGPAPTASYGRGWRIVGCDGRGHVFDVIFMGQNGRTRVSGLCLSFVQHTSVLMVDWREGYHRIH
jgi:hypothetical protein